MPAVPLLSSLFLAGKLESRRSPEAFSLPSGYIRLLVDILLHREFVLLDGLGSCPTEPFDESDNLGSRCTPTLGTSTDSSSTSSISGGNTCSRCGQTCGLSELDPAAFFLSKTPPCRGPDDLPCRWAPPSSSSNCFSPSLSLMPRLLPRRFARLQQTPAYVRLLTLALLDGVCCSLASRGHETSPQAAFLRHTASAVFRSLSARAVESVSSPTNDAEGAGIPEGEAQEHDAANAHLPMPNSAKHRRQLRVWQALSCLSRHVGVLLPEACEDLAEGVWWVLNSALMPDVRHYVEFVAVRLTLGTPQCCIPRIVGILRRYNAPRQVLISALAIGGYTLLHLQHFLPKGQEETAKGLERQLLHAITPYLTSNAAYCRAIAQYLLYRFLSIPSSLEERQEETNNGDLHSSSPLPPLYSMLDQAKECRMMISKVAAAFSRWNPEEDGGIYTLIPESGIVEENIEQHGARTLHKVWHAEFLDCGHI